MRYHQGAASDNITYTRVAKCYYSSETKLYETNSKYWSEEKQENLNMKFMRNDCQCQRCKTMRTDRMKTIRALQRDQDDAGLQAMGYYG